MGEQGLVNNSATRFVGFTSHHIYMYGLSNIHIYIYMYIPSALGSLVPTLRGTFFFFGF